MICITNTPESLLHHSIAYYTVAYEDASFTDAVLLETKDIHFFEEHLHREYEDACIDLKFIRVELATFTRM